MADDLSPADMTAGSPVLDTAALVNKLTLRAVEERHKQFEAGEDWALLDAVDLCARAGVVIPEWAANAFCERYMDWHLFRAKSLDTAFGVTRKKMHVDGRMLREWLRPRVALHVLLRAAKGEAIDETLFGNVGKDLEISGPLAKKVYYDDLAREGYVTVISALLSTR